MSTRRHMLVLLLTVILILSACAGDVGEDGEETDGGEAEGGGGQEVSVAAVWTGVEQEGFEAVLQAFEGESGNTYTYQSSDDLAAFLGTQIEGGDPPDVALLPQPGLLRELAADGSLQEIGEDAAANLEENYAPIWSELGSVDGTLYGVYFKAASKGTWWYNTTVFEQAGVEPPGTWDEMLQTASTVNQSGVPFLSIGVADGWPLTDMFENVYLQTAGPEMYDQLTNHEIKWTDQSVIEALTTMGDLVGDPANLAGGTEGSVQDDFVTSVTQVFSDPPEAATVYEGDFVAGVIGGETNAKVGQDADFFPFPTIAGEGGVVGGGDVAVALTDNPAAQELSTYLATPEAAEIWASKGGFTSPNQNMSLDVYPDDVSRRIAEGLIDASESGAFRFDMSDLQPAEFGATGGRGMFLRLQQFFENPNNVEGAARNLEKDAAAAFGQ
jgi:alpha-glucoside transport system substrate-binding protein